MLLWWSKRAHEVEYACAVVRPRPSHVHTVALFAQGTARERILSPNLGGGNELVRAREGGLAGGIGHRNGRTRGGPFFFDACHVCFGLVSPSFHVFRTDPKHVVQTSPPTSLRQTQSSGRAWSPRSSCGPSAIARQLGTPAARSPPSPPSLNTAHPRLGAGPAAAAVISSNSSISSRKATLRLELPAPQTRRLASTRRRPACWPTIARCWGRL